MSITVTLRNDQSSYRPGDDIHGTVTWQSESREPAELVIGLLWKTDGKGSNDVGQVDNRNTKLPGRSGERDFSFTLPPGPWSFSGHLISLTWLVEAVLKPEDDYAHQEFTLSPDGNEVDLTSTIVHTPEETKPSLIDAFKAKRDSAES